MRKCIVCGTETDKPKVVMISNMHSYVCSYACINKFYNYNRPTQYAPDAASATSAEPLSGLESVPAVEADTQPRG